MIIRLLPLFPPPAACSSSSPPLHLLHPPPTIRGITPSDDGHLKHRPVFTLSKNKSHSPSAPQLVLERPYHLARSLAVVGVRVWAHTAASGQQLRRLSHVNPEGVDTSSALVVNAAVLNGVRAEQFCTRPDNFTHMTTLTQILDSLGHRSG
ncbi:unnamed protein product [Pleuronectes platessa]|uniref:Uncharacterized protein n=1 Tax=Pleuronectes platessa TaxID=8262 RepID=A0A9N7U3K5_PLEPL|nr:unnamed protein product [Pleuronectes platessa]